jgi:hypothetical protein
MTYRYYLPLPTKDAVTGQEKQKKDKSTNPLKSWHRQLYKVVVLRSYIRLFVLYVEDHSIGMMMLKGRLMKLECF